MVMRVSCAEMVSIQEDRSAPASAADRCLGLLAAIPRRALATATLAAALLSWAPAFQAQAQAQAAPASSAGAAPGPEATVAPSAPVRAAISLVQRAAAAVRQQGEAAFPAFRKRGAPWFEGENYVVVLGADGRSVVYPPDGRGEGLSYEPFEDLGGKPFGRQLLAVGDSPEGRGWVHYQWRRPNPADRRPVWKATYVERVVAPSGKGYLVLSGLYDPPMERLFVVDAVEGASRLLQRQGRDGFAALRDAKGPFFYQNTYVFLLKPDGTLLLNPAFPALEGRDALALPQATDRASLKAALQEALRQGSSWARYSWPRPGTTAGVERKTTYLRKVVLPGGEVLVVGSGLYELP
jgi:signal transduction histidine kinase